MIWLPPSEGKTAPTSGPALDLSTLSLPVLRHARETVIEDLAALGEGHEAAQRLGLGPRSASEAAANTHLREAPCAPARTLYTGVLFAAAGFHDMDPTALERAHTRVLVFSGLFGAVGPGDLLPDHRLPMGATLPGTGRLTTFWRAPLRAALEPLSGGRVILDLRSGPYRSACPAPWAHVLRLGVVRERVGGRGVVSHDAKTWRGLVCGALLRAGDLPDDEAGAREAVATHARAVTTREAHGTTHRVVSVEISPARATREGGTSRDIVLVTN